MDRGDLMLFSEVHQGQQRLLSVQEGYELMVSAAELVTGGGILELVAQVIWRSR
jgi:hypothetical protein